MAALLAAVPVLAACTHAGPDPATSGRSGGTRPAGARHHRDGHAGTGISLAAVRAGLRDPASHRPAFYLSLGDSLALGIQPAPGGRDVPTSHGYADQLAVRLRGALPQLRLVKLGCSGETTSTMIHGGICRYPAGGQLGQAARFLRSHRGRTALITIDIGANDPNSCVLSGGLASILPCVVTRMPQIDQNLSTILATLRSAAGPRVLIVGMTYYVPELGLWHQGKAGRQIAILTGAVAAGANQMLVARYRLFRARVANVFAAFRSSDFGLRNGHAHAGTAGLAGGPGDPAAPVPPNVASICALTWMCARAPRGPNEHPNNAGYHVIARAFWRAIAASP
jgi:lysophospholipase L1-like esterase